MDYDPADDDITEMMQEHRRLDLKKRRGNVDFDTLFDTFADDYFYDEGPTRSLTHWKQQDGKVLKISDMTRQHLKNAIRFLTEKYSPDTELIEVLAEELEEKETKEKTIYTTFIFSNVQSLDD